MAQADQAIKSYSKVKNVNCSAYLSVASQYQMESVKKCLFDGFSTTNSAVISKKHDLQKVANLKLKIMLLK